MLKRLATKMWGEFESREELQKFGLLAVMFFLIIGIYWGLRPLKDSIFNALVGGKAYQPWAKGVSLSISLPLVIFYSKLVDWFPRQKVFYVLVSLYGLAALVFMWAFMHPTIGLANTVTSPDRWIGWAWYVYIEMFGSLVVALFWALVTDITLPKAARRGFPFIALFGQFGNMMGPWALRAHRFGFVNSAPLVGILAGLMFGLVALMWFFFRVTPEDQLKSYEAKSEGAKDKKPAKAKHEAGFLEGLKLLLTEGYLLGIFAVIFVYEVIVTILDFHFKATVFDTFSTEAEVANMLAQYGTMTGVVSSLCVLFGINSIQRRLGMRASLLLLPLLVTGAVVLVWTSPTSLLVAFWIMVFAKAVNYALNQPTIKQLYIPTTKETKYKATAWIEMFGGRSSKGTGSLVNGFRASFTSVSAFLTMASFISFGLIGIWFFVAVYIAKTYNKAIKEDRVVC